MEIHRPKPPHTMREFLSEVAIVILGVCIALSAEQALQSIEWHHKIKLAEEQMRQEVANDNGPQISQRLALSACVNESLDAIRNAVEQGAERPAVASLIEKHWTPRHTWDSTNFQAAEASGVVARLSVARLDAISRFYSLMPVLAAADEREARDSATLFVSRIGGPLSELERDRLLGSVEALLRGNAEIVRLASLAQEAMKRLGIQVGIRSPTEMGSAPLSDPQRVIVQMEQQPMASRCVADLKAAMHVK